MRLAPLVAATVLIGVLLTPSAAVAQSDAAPTPSDLMYLTATGPFRAKLTTYQERLSALVAAATDGQLDEIALSDLADLSRELFLARRAFVNALPSARLDQYDRTVELGTGRAYDATVLLLRAQVSDSAPDREALLRDASVWSRSSRHLFEDAADELRAVLPGIDQ